jgi:SAM-dependent methyltransferase
MWRAVGAKVINLPAKASERRHLYESGRRQLMTTPDAQSTEQFKEMILQEWTDQGTVAAWRKWHPQFVVQTAAAKDAIVEAIEVKRGMQVLDLASGTGEPALTLAELAGSEGHVTATDLGPGMLATAEENARQAGLNNMTFLQADAHALPFPDQSFDRVTCRFGVMYFADSFQALREIYRVLKPGGRVVFVAWGPLEQNPFMLKSLGPFFKRVEIPPPPPGAPQPFKYAEPGTLSGELEGSGFRQVKEESRTLSFPWPGPPEELWQHFQDIAAPFRPIFNSLPLDQLDQAIAEVVEGYRQYYDGQQVDFPANIVLASGIR